MTTMRMREEDEEEIDVDVLQAGSSERASWHMAQLLQEQTEQQARYEDD